MQTNESFEVIPSKRGGKVLSKNGYLYHHKRKNKADILWVCELAMLKITSTKCPGSIKTNHEMTTVIPGTLVVAQETDESEDDENCCFSCI